MTQVKPYRIRGSGLILPATRPESRQLSNTGLVAPSSPGFTLAPEPWEPLTVALGRFVPSEDMQITFLEFHVVYAASANDLCCIGILDMYGDVLVASPLTANMLNVVGPQFWAPATPYILYGGTPYYVGFGYGAVGGSPASLLTACYAEAPDLEGYGGGNTQQFGYQNTLVYTTVDGTLKAPSAAVGAIAPYVNWGQCVYTYLRTG